MAPNSMGAWFKKHPEALKVVRAWLNGRVAGKNRDGTRVVVERLKRLHDFPFHDHQSLSAFCSKRYPKLYPKALAAGPAAKPIHREPEPDFKRSTGDLKKLNEYTDFFVTSAVQNCHANPGYLAAMHRWKDYTGGAVICNKVNYANPRTRKEEEIAKRGKWYDDDLEEFMFEQELRPHESLALLTMKAGATADNPIPARLDGRTKHRSAVFGHPQLSMRTVATHPSRLPKIMYSSGACTDPFYSDTIAGYMAEFHHSLAGVIVEVRGDRFHLREVVWDGESFIDCDSQYFADGHYEAPPAEALIMGDIHAPHFVAPNVMDAVFGSGGIYETINPRRLVLHDLADNRAINPHEANSRLTRAALAQAGNLCIEAELQGVIEWLQVLPEFEEILVVRSNHDDFLDRWLQFGKPEPGSAKFFHFMSYHMLDEHDRIGKFPLALELALRSMCDDLPSSLRFLGLDEPYVLLNVLLSMHGHKGVNGARGGKSLSRIGSRTVFGHTHSPFIWQGAHCVGLSGLYNHGYNSGGASSWLQTMCALLANGRKQMLHVIGDNFRG